MHVDIGVASVAEPVVSITLFLPTTPPNITLNCTVTSTPIAQITWVTTGTNNVLQLQLPTGFREPSMSQLTVITSELVGVNTFTCVGTLGRKMTNASAVVNIFGE